MQKVWAHLPPLVLHFPFCRNLFLHLYTCWWRIQCEGNVNISPLLVQTQCGAAILCNSVGNDVYVEQYLGVWYWKPGIVFQAAENRHTLTTRLRQPAGVKTMPSASLCACAFTHPGLSPGVTGLGLLFHLIHRQIFLWLFIWRRRRRRCFKLHTNASWSIKKLLSESLPSKCAQRKLISNKALKDAYWYHFVLIAS